MNGKRITATLLPGVLLAALALAGPRAALGQSWTWVSTGETGGDDVGLLYTQIGVTADRMGLRPTASLSAYRVSTEFDDQWALGPAVGMEYRTDGGSISGDLGYSFKNEDGDFPFFGGDRSGVTTGVHAEYWGEGRIGVQGLASYNWGSDYLWSRARGTTRLAQMGQGALHLGGELVWQGETASDGPGMEKYSATQIGPVLQWIHPRGFILGAGGGWKDDSFRADDTHYFKVELVLSR